jgi:DNA polymerase III subunit epsilon
MTQTIEQLAQQVEQHPDYRVLRRLSPRKAFRQTTPQNALRKGIVLDTETTELGMLIFEFDPHTGEIYRVTDVFDELEDPGFPIPPASVAIHHITDEMVQGKHIDDFKIEELLSSVDVVIAHNAGFDRPFVESRWPVFMSKKWACSIKDIDWKTEGFGSAKLEYLLSTQGLFYEAHRAETDCWALLELLNFVLPQSQQPALLSLLETLNAPQSKVYALNSPFETKDMLKSRGYRWQADLRCWSKVLQGEQEKTQEFAWLKNHVYGNRQARVEVETLGATMRYSLRMGQKEIVTL